MAYFSFVALAFAGATLFYAEEAKKQTDLLRVRVEELERQNGIEEEKRFGDES